MDDSQSRAYQEAKTDHVLHDLYFTDDFLEPNIFQNINT